MANTILIHFSQDHQEIVNHAISIFISIHIMAVSGLKTLKVSILV